MDIPHTHTHTHTPITTKTTIPGLLFADDLVFCSFIIDGLYIAADHMTKCCREEI
jgi:hypothetical protein